MCLPVIDELAKCFVRFMQRCLSSYIYAVTFIANYGVYVGRMFSPIGRNDFFCCLTVCPKIQKGPKIQK